MTVFNDAIRTLERLGVADVLLPFFLIFTLVYAILQKTKILGSGSDSGQKFNVIVAFVVGMGVVFPHVLQPGSPWDVVPIINQSMPIVLLGVVGILGFLLLATFFSGAEWKPSKTLQAGFNVVALLFVGYIFLVNSNFIQVPFFLRNLLSNSVLVNTVIALVFFIIIIGYIVGPTGGNSNKSLEESAFTKLFGPGGSSK